MINFRIFEFFDSYLKMGETLAETWQQYAGTVSEQVMYTVR